LQPFSASLWILYICLAFAVPVCVWFVERLNTEGTIPVRTARLNRWSMYCQTVPPCVTHLSFSYLAAELDVSHRVAGGSILPQQLQEPEQGSTAANPTLPQGSTYRLMLAIFNVDVLPVITLPSQIVILVFLCE
jgi:hypothetical protein